MGNADNVRLGETFEAMSFPMFTFIIIYCFCISMCYGFVRFQNVSSGFPGVLAGVLRCSEVSKRFNNPLCRAFLF